MDPESWWQCAGETECEALPKVFSRLRATDKNVVPVVQRALWIEIFEDYDYKSWPNEFQLSGRVPPLQELVSRECEWRAIDRVQRVNYMTLAMGGKERHNDVAYGLSEKMVVGGENLTSEKQRFINALLQMGKRQYNGPIPRGHEMDNHVIHVAVSYRHTSKYFDHGSINTEQAEAIWRAVRSLPFVNETTEARVWIDQNLHRQEFPLGSEWHEFGLLPYLCLTVVSVGEGEFSLKYAYTRPWLWVEALAALKADGIRTAPGRDPVEDSQHILTKLERFEKLKPVFKAEGWIIGAGRNVDDGMAEMARNVSLWRREGFMNHSSYDYADEFEHFVNWARWFVVRGVKYSEMSWNHSSTRAVRGMDAVVLLRNMPKRSGHFQAESILALVRPKISWARCSRREDWVVGDILDRTLIDEVPIRTIVEHIHSVRGSAEELTITGNSLLAERARFTLENEMISFEYDTSAPRPAGQLTSPLLESQESALSDVLRGNRLVSLSTSCESECFVRHSAFTRRMKLANRTQQVPLGDASVAPRRISSDLKQTVGLNQVGISCAASIFERVYEFAADNGIVRLSASEISDIAEACDENPEKFKALSIALKHNCQYLENIWRDLSDRLRLKLSRGWGLDDQAFTAEARVSKCSVSGEWDADISVILTESLRRTEGTVMVTVDEIGTSDTVMISFGTKRETRRITADRIHAGRELAILDETPLDQLANTKSTGLLQMLAGIQPGLRVKRFGSGVNPRIEPFEEGIELNNKAVNGMFVRCKPCGKTVCQINGLVVETDERDGLYHVEWQERHKCLNPQYERFKMRTGVRII